VAAGSRIRPLTPADEEELAALREANADFLAPFSPARPPKPAPDPPETRRFAILDGGAIAGTISLTNVARGAFQSADVGYWVDRARNGRGLATDAVAAVVAVAFGELGLPRLEAGTLVDNLASQRVLEKNGFQRIGLARGYLHIAGDRRDHVLFRRIADDL
jgi:ribosomal-protein-alanine N-acetyltransferase